jgi:predicted MFS family arabinose efflux permease
LFVLFGINALNFYDRQILAAVTEPIRKEWGLSDSAMGLLGTAFTLLYAAVGVPLGRLADAWTRTKLLGIGVAVWSLLTAASGLAWNYWSLFVARLGVGVGEASCAPAANSLIGDLYPANQRARALSIFMLGLPVGLFLSFWLSGKIAHAFGWRAAFYFACLPGLLFAVLALRIPEPVRGAVENYRAITHPHGRSPYWAVLSIPTMWWIIISGALFNFNMYALGGFTPAFLSRYHLLNLKESNNISAIVFGVAGLCGLLGGGWMADRLNKTWPTGRLLFASMTLVLASPFLYFGLAKPAGAIAGFTLLMGTSLALMYAYYSCVYAALQDVVEPSLRGTAMALYFFAMYVLGASVGPVGTGMLSDHFARKAMTAAGATTMTESFKAAGLHDAMKVIPMLCLGVAFVLFAASRTVAADMEKLRRNTRH